MPTAPSSGAKKLGQPVPLSNFRSATEQRLSARHARERSGAVFLEQRAGPGALGAVAAQHLVLLRRQDLPPLFVGLHDFERFALSTLTLVTPATSLPRRSTLV